MEVIKKKFFEVKSRTLKFGSRKPLYIDEAVLVNFLSKPTWLPEFANLENEPITKFDFFESLKLSLARIIEQFFEVVDYIVEKNIVQRSNLVAELRFLVNRFCAFATAPVFVWNKFVTRPYQIKTFVHFVRFVFENKCPYKLFSVDFEENIEPMTITNMVSYDPLVNLSLFLDDGFLMHCHLKIWSLICREKDIVRFVISYIIYYFCCLVRSRCFSIAIRLLTELNPFEHDARRSLLNAEFFGYNTNRPEYRNIRIGDSRLIVVSYTYLSHYATYVQFYIQLTFARNAEPFQSIDDWMEFASRVAPHNVLPREFLVTLMNVELLTDRGHNLRFLDLLCCSNYVTLTRYSDMINIHYIIRIPSQLLRQHLFHQVAKIRAFYAYFKVLSEKLPIQCVDHILQYVPLQPLFVNYLRQSRHLSSIYFTNLYR